MPHSPNLRQRLAGGVLALLAATSLSAGNLSSDGLWRDVEESTALRASGVSPRATLPREYRTLRLDEAALDRLLAFVPHESTTRAAESPSLIELPLPDGRYETFRIVEAPVMAPALAARYPHLRTWMGQGVDDPSASVRLDFGPKGFHAQILSWRGTMLIDPLAPGDRQHVIAYRKRDAQAQGPRPTCLLTGDELAPDLPDFSKRGKAVNLASGSTLRTHRLAMAATGEYTQFHGGTVADGLAAIVTTMNRVNGIYERELAVRMQLIADNDRLIYTDGASDPYTNNSGTTMLGENQSNLDAVIGSANYDIGHVVSTGGGGVASLGSVCSATNKARGVTGLGSPIGDVFDVDYVAHEIGHQYGGRHTFNGGGGSCAGGNRSASAAYEPGSGITIQAYAGICGGDNLQRNSEDYFHRVSLNEMLTFTTSGNGANCGSTSATGNTPPTVSTTAAFTIPQLTPFRLEASGNDSNGDALTFLWEQFDLGARNATGVLVDDGSRPLFRSFIPTLDSSRIFPSLRYILNNANDVPNTAPLPGTNDTLFTGERLPSTNRTLNFRVTARDNRAGGGGTNEALTTLTVTTAAGPFRITAPNSATTVTAGQPITVTWDVANTDLAPVSTSQVRVALSYDGGLSFPVVSNPVPNNGSHTFNLPANLGTSRARVRVAAENNVFFDINDADFTIAGPNSPPTITVTNPVATSQGGPTASAPVATISDVQDPAGSLAVAIEGQPVELDVSVANVGGTVTLSATAACTLVAPTNGSRVYPLTLRATDSGGAVSTAEVSVNVSRNLTPTLGTYAATSMGSNAGTQVTPSAPPADGNDNLVGTEVTPTSLPGGGSVSIDGAGVVSISTSGVAPGSHPILATAVDSCGARETRQFVLTVSGDDLFANGFE